ncbi:MFS transporter [Maribellus luteus]|uniref:MFS transporter n=1 Tax=Maribellus luteus TaxID=2305463 RepID=A0A399SQX9_9BACT|nr:MFS transporter [Maribellus luteus]RIJ46476.1 MFS transporter [Maribellus luteus]
MTNSKIKLKLALPVFMSFIVMGFVDIVGVATGYVKQDFGLTDKVAQFLPSMALMWFFFLSVPTGLLIERFGKKMLLNIGMAITGVGMLVPFIHYSFPVMLTAFVFLGIGNTIVQVAANPLLHDVVPKEKYASSLSLAQFIKAICSLLGPIITTFMAAKFGNWKLVFIVYAVTSLISILWLYFTKIEEARSNETVATFKTCFSLLKNKFVLVLVLGIFVTVGADVGMNSNIANFLQNQFDLSLENASLGISIYFTALMIGRFLGAVLLNWISARKFLFITTLVALVSLVAMMFSPNALLARICIFMIGLGSANLFPLIFAIAVDKLPARVNEISGLMIMAVAGGAFIPPVMGYVSSIFGVVASFLVLVIVMVYLLAISFYVQKAGKKNI